ncbi:MAG: DNA repair protein RecN [Candidatus Sumerlaeia bacterium]
MLKRLAIQNLATIERIEIDFAAGLNALTGETGAGKSILIEGLELALGDRASAESIRAGEKMAVVEAIFAPPLPKATLALAREIGLEIESGEPIEIRRELAASGRNRCFINDQMVAVADLKTIGEALVDFHGQHEHQSLFRPDAARVALDDWAGHEKLLSTYREAYDDERRLQKRRAELEEAARDFDKRVEWLDFQLEELEKISPRLGEIAALEQEERRLAHAEALGRAAGEAYALLYEGADEQASALAQLREVRRRVAELAEIETEFAEALARLGDHESGLEDIAYALRDYREKIEADPERLNEVIGRLESIRRLARKHGGDETQLLAAWDKLKAEREQMTRDDADRRAIDADLQKAAKKLEQAAGALTAARAAAAERFGKAVESALRQLNMEKARLAVTLEPLPEPAADGADRIEFLLAANPGLPPAPLRKIGSGGEISRVMLAIKSAMAGRDAIPTMVFDEIDAGVSGEAARRVAALLERLADSRQILCITHLAPIAARAASHVSVRKSVRGKATYTEAEPLTNNDRVEELARMMGGDGNAKSARELARQLMK